ncbi:MAG: hypothetical protein N4A36_02645 [Candidatus Gracilibacteria bacterium]|jgi:hypothetical protein|nr:hypothetical protein [Candidatus Gracilibacteria bacterium]
MNYQNLKKLTAIFLSINLLLGNMAFAKPTQAKSPLKEINSQIINFKDLPPFPEDLKRKPEDWSKVDWDAEIILPNAYEQMIQEEKRLESQGRYKEAKNLKPKKYKMSDDVVL